MEPWQVGTISEFQRPVALIDNGHCLNQHTGHAKHTLAEDGESSCYADDDLAAAMNFIYSYRFRNTRAVASFLQTPLQIDTDSFC